jgi:lytic murein transglycosylase
MPSSIRRFATFAGVLCWMLIGANAPMYAADAAFQKWLESVWPDAKALGVSRATFDKATRDLEPDLKLPDLDLPGRPITGAAQAEFVQTPVEYLRESSFDNLAAKGRKLLDQHRETLTKIERQFGVPPGIVLAIWGRETGFGAAKMPYSAIRALATQAYVGRRKDFFRNEFLLTLKILQEGHVAPADLRSSWAGAMGHAQILPSGFYKYAVDLDGDGKRDIWNSIPDALAALANHLKTDGWQRGKRWAYEVRVPKDVDCTIAEPSVTLPLGEWVKRGYVLAAGRKLSPGEADEKASLLMPAGLYGPAFLAPKNYFVLKDYNFSDLYVLFVGHLSDRITDPRPFEQPWRQVTQLKSTQLEAMQNRLTELGIYRDKIDGKAGMLTRAALGAYQKQNGLTLDCWPTAAVLDHMLARRK